jgi:hypothetical protein
VRTRALPVGAVLILAACVGDLVELPASPGDATVAHDLATLSSPPDMSGPVRYFPDIQADVERLGCTGSSCHGGTQTPVLLPMPSTQAQRDANYMDFTADCNATDPPNSLIIQKALGNLNHGGGAPLSMSDPAYARWIAWIAAGMVE